MRRNRDEHKEDRINLFVNRKKEKEEEKDVFIVVNEDIGENLVFVSNQEEQRLNDSDNFHKKYIYIYLNKMLNF